MISETVKLNDDTKYINMLEMWGKEEYEIMGCPGEPDAHINFYLPICFDAEAAFGLRSCESSGSDYINLYADWYPESKLATMTLCHITEEDDTAYVVELDQRQMQKLQEVISIICKDAYGKSPNEIWEQAFQED